MKETLHQKLGEKIKQAMEDSIITTAEYEDIVNTAGEIGALPRHERAMLRQFNCLIADGTLRRVPSL
jgi:hypothetical protein